MAFWFPPKEKQSYRNLCANTPKKNPTTSGPGVQVSWVGTALFWVRIAASRLIRCEQNARIESGGFEMTTSCPAWLLRLRSRRVLLPRLPLAPWVSLSCMPWLWITPTTLLGVARRACPPVTSILAEPCRLARLPTPLVCVLRGLFVRVACSLPLLGSSFSVVTVAYY